MNDLINKVRNNKVASWGLALFVGLIFRYADGILRHQIFMLCRSWDFGTSTHPTPDSQFLALTIVFNLAIVLVSSLIASALCGGVLVYIFQEKASKLCLGSIAVFLALNSRVWRFWTFPELGMQISRLMGPLVAGTIFFLTVLLLVKVRGHITPA